LKSEFFRKKVVTRDRHVIYGMIAVDLAAVE